MSAVTFASLRPAAEARSEAAPNGLVHLHFGAGRLGLGLIAPFFRKPGSKLYLFNRAVSGRNETGSTGLGADRRNRLLRENLDNAYVIQAPGGGPAARREVVRYDGFFEYDDRTLDGIVGAVAAEAARDGATVVVSASVLKAENYGPVVQALNAIAGRLPPPRPEASRPEALRGCGGKVFLVACENTLSAHDVLRDERLCALLTPEAASGVTCVHALVDRMCVGLEETTEGPHPAVLVRAEEYGSLKLEVDARTEHLPAACAGSRIEFSRHVDTEKQIKSWLLNGTHWLIALDAYARTRGDRGLKLNAFLEAEPENARFARQVMDEMRDGVAAILRSNPEYARFARDVDVDGYLDSAAQAILRRFATTEDPITRILARFQAPKRDAHSTVESFTKRFADRVDEPMRAYEARHGTVPPAASHGVQSLVRLLASGTFIDARPAG